MRSKGQSAREKLILGFVELLSEKAYLEITVTDIVSKAEVSRVSFYRNFSSISNLVDEAAEELMDRIDRDIGEIVKVQGVEVAMRTLLRRFFENMYISRDKFTFVHTTNLPYIFSKVEEKFIAYAARSAAIWGLHGKYSITCIIGIATAVTRQWLKFGAEETPDELCDYLEPLIRTICQN